MLIILYGWIGPLSMFFYFSEIYVEIYRIYTPPKKTWSTDEGGGRGGVWTLMDFFHLDVFFKASLKGKTSP